MSQKKCHKKKGIKMWQKKCDILNCHKKIVTFLIAAKPLLLLLIGKRISAEK